MYILVKLSLYTEISCLFFRLSAHHQSNINLVLLPYTSFYFLQLYISGIVEYEFFLSFFLKHNIFEIQEFVACLSSTLFFIVTYYFISQTSHYNLFTKLLTRGSQIRDILPARGHFQCLGTFLVIRGFWRRGQSGHRPGFHKGQLPTTKN